MKLKKINKKIEKIQNENKELLELFFYHFKTINELHEYIQKIINVEHLGLCYEVSKSNSIEEFLKNSNLDYKAVVFGGNEKNFKQYGVRYGDIFCSLYLTDGELKMDSEFSLYDKAEIIKEKLTIKEIIKINSIIEKIIRLESYTQTI